MWIIQLSDNGIIAKSINRKLAALSSYFNFLQQSDPELNNPVKLIKPLKVPSKLPDYVSETDMKGSKVLESELFLLDTFEGYRDYVILELFYGTGIRLSELIGLQDIDINFTRQSLKVLGKGNKERIIPIHKKLLEILSEYLNKKNNTVFENKTTSLIVTNTGDKTYPVFVRRTVVKYLKLISTIEKNSPHVLRHTFATHMLNAGADLLAVKELLGHASLASTQIYTHNTMDKLRLAFKQAHPKA